MWMRCTALAVGSCCNMTLFLCLGGSRYSYDSSYGFLAPVLIILLFDQIHGLKSGSRRRAIWVSRCWCRGSCRYYMSLHLLILMSRLVNFNQLQVARWFFGPTCLCVRAHVCAVYFMVVFFHFILHFLGTSLSIFYLNNFNSGVAGWHWEK
jgi:hypothetical protein